MKSDFNSTSGVYSGAGGYTEDERVAHDVECSVTHCVYNKDAKLCLAGHIQVGPTSATSVGDTICATFRKE